MRQNGEKKIFLTDLLKNISNYIYFYMPTDRPVLKINKSVNLRIKNYGLSD